MELKIDILLCPSFRLRAFASFLKLFFLYLFFGRIFLYFWPCFVSSDIFASDFWSAPFGCSDSAHNSQTEYLKEKMFVDCSAMFVEQVFESSFSFFYVLLVSTVLNVIYIIQCNRLF